jgi:hypothetical protein
VTLVQDVTIQQAADWPGWAYYVVDSLGAPKQLAAPMTAWGFIGQPGRVPIFRWSTSPPDAVTGLITFDGTTLIPTCTAEQTAAFQFSNAPYQLYLRDPAGPPGEQTIRVAEGTVYLDRSNGG